MVDIELRRKVGWLIATRAIIGTILLGSAILLEATAPGLFETDRLFFLIGLTYSLTIAYAISFSPRIVDAWLFGLRAYDHGEHAGRASSRDR